MAANKPPPPARPSSSESGSGSGSSDHKSYFWVPDNDEVWVLAIQITPEQPNGCCKFETIATKRSVIIPLSQAMQAAEYYAKNYVPPEDLVSLPDVNAGSILNSTRIRFQSNDIYTSLGSVLMLVNPFQRIEKLYGVKLLELYRNPYAQDLRSHLYLVPSRAFSNLTLQGKSQSILISGESGAGKTEATKECLAFLTHVAGGGAAECVGGSS